FECGRCLVFFFFSSRRRHTRWPRDWSSDVCSSDLYQSVSRWCGRPSGDTLILPSVAAADVGDECKGGIRDRHLMPWERRRCNWRSEERRVGKEGGVGGGRESCREIE